MPKDIIASTSCFFTKRYSSGQIQTLDHAKLAFRAKRSFAFLERFSGINPEQQSPLSIKNLKKMLNNIDQILPERKGISWIEDFKRLYSVVKKTDIVLKHALTLETYSLIKQSGDNLLSIRERQRQKLTVNNQRTGNSLGRDDSIYLSVGVADHTIDQAFSLNPDHQTVVINVHLKNKDELQKNSNLRFLWMGPHSTPDSHVPDIMELGTTKRILIDTNGSREYRYERQTGERVEFKLEHSHETVIANDLYEFIALKLLLELYYIGDPYCAHVLANLNDDDILGAAINCLFRYPTFDAKIPVKFNLDHSDVNITLLNETSDDLKEVMSCSQSGNQENYSLRSLLSAIDSEDLNEISDILDQQPDLINLRAFKSCWGSDLLDKPTPLLYALSSSYSTAVVELLLLKGASVLMKNAFGATALHCTVRNTVPNSLILKILLTREPYIKDGTIKFLLNPNIESYEPFLQNGTPLMLACAASDNSIAEILLMHNAYPNGHEIMLLAGSSKSEPLPIFLENHSIKRWREALVFAALCKNLKFIELILDPNFNNYYQSDDPKRFLDEETSIRALLAAFSQENCRKIPYCDSHLSIIELLCKRGINVNALDEYGRNALYIARLNQCTRIASTLVLYGSNEVSNTLPMNVVKRKSSVAVIRAINSRSEAYYLMGRKYDNEGNCLNEFVFPGGLVEDKEDSQQAAIREAFEETGIDVKQSGSKLLFTYNGIKTCRYYSKGTWLDLNIQTDFYLFDVGQLDNHNFPLACSDFAFVKWVPLREILLENADKKAILRKSNYQLIVELEQSPNFRAENIIDLLDQENNCVSEDQDENPEKILVLENFGVKI